MKICLPLLSVILCLPCVVIADEIRLSSVETPDQVGTFYIDDMQNSGDVSNQQGQVACIDQLPFAITVGDLAGADILGRARKDFLLFRLPSLQGKKLTGAKLRLFLGEIQHEAKEKPLPPVWVFHAEKWDDGAWVSDPRMRGVQTSHFGDTENFSTKLPLCGPDDKAGFIELDVTGMIQADYQRSPEPVAAFRIEVSDHEQLDITDEYPNTYNFWGPAMLQHPDHVPALELSFE